MTEPGRGPIPPAGGPVQTHGPREDGPARPRPPAAPAFNAPRVVVWLVLATVAMHLVLHYGGVQIQAWLFELLALIPIRFSVRENWGVNWAATLASPLGHALVHLDWMHLIVNMGMALGFGAAVARRASARGFLALYGLSVFVGAAAAVALDPMSQIPRIGASGGVSGLMGAVCAMGLAQARGGPMAPPPFHRPGLAISFSLIFFAMNLGFAILSARLGIAWEAHVGGFVAGFVFCRWVDRGQQALI